MQTLSDTGKGEQSVKIYNRSILASHPGVRRDTACSIIGIPAAIALLVINRDIPGMPEVLERILKQGQSCVQGPIDAHALDVLLNSCSVHQIDI